MNAGPAPSEIRENPGATRAQWGELTRTLVARNLKIRYKGSVLGFFWSLLTPALTILMYAVFAHILKFAGSRPHYLEFLVTGIIAWTFTAGALNDSLFSIAGNANLVKKVWFPRAILPVSTALANAVNYLLTVVPLVLYLWIAGALDLSHGYWLLPAFFFHLLLCTGVACLVGTLNAFFRDVQHVVGVGQLAWFFLTPVFYGLEMQLRVFPDRAALQGLAFLNPMTGILALYRRGLMGEPFVPAAPGVAATGAWTVLSCAVCALVFFAGAAAVRAGDRRFGDVL